MLISIYVFGIGIQTDSTAGAPRFRIHIPNQSWKTAVVRYLQRRNLRDWKKFILSELTAGGAPEWHGYAQSANKQPRISFVLTLAKHSILTEFLASLLPSLQYRRLRPSIIKAGSQTRVYGDFYVVQRETTAREIQLRLHEHELPNVSATSCSVPGTLPSVTLLQYQVSTVTRRITPMLHKKNPVRISTYPYRVCT